MAAAHRLDPAVVRLKWMVLGRFDHLALNLSDDRTEMADSEYDQRPDSVLSYYGHLSYYGRFTYPANFDWAEAYDQFGLAGFCTIRVRQGGRSSAPAEDLRVGETLKQLLSGLDLRWVFGATTGWDDHVVFLFSKSYNTILQAIWKIRDFPDTDLGSEWLLTSCTLPLIRFDWTESCENRKGDGKSARAALVRRLNRIVTPNEKIGWAVRFAVQPGQVQNLRAQVTRAAAEQSIDIVVTKLFGQADFRCAGYGPSTTQDSLIRFLVHAVFPLVTEPDTAVRNIETHLHLDTVEPPRTAAPHARSSRKAEPAKRSRRTGRSQLDPHVVAQLQKGGIPRNTVNALRNVFSRIDLLQETELLAGEFDSLLALRDQFNHSAAHLKFSELVRPPLLHELVSDWLTGLERCLADRYRGIYPTGESITMRMATYHASHQKFLRVADHLIACASSLALRSIETQRRAHGRDAQKTLPRITAVVHLGNSPTGQYAGNLRHFGTSFIELPVSEVFSFGRSEVLLHETGHHVVKACLSSPAFQLEPILRGCAGHYEEEDEMPAGIRQFSEQQRRAIANLVCNGSHTHFQEILAEFFSCSLGFGGDVGRQWQARSALITATFTGEDSSALEQNPVFARTKFTLELRNGIVGILLNRLHRSIRPDESCLQEVREKFSRDARNLSCEEILADASTAFWALCELMRLPEFAAIIWGLSPAAVNPLLEREPVLKSYRALLTRPDGGLVESFDALREAWSAISAE